VKAAVTDIPKKEEAEPSHDGHGGGMGGKSSVDGKEIAWGGTTTYSSQCASAIATWNARGKISITPDTIWTVEDLTFVDVNSTASWYKWNGLWQQNTYADYLYQNKAYMASMSSAYQQNVCTHELGHALGLAHSIAANVMYSYSTSTTALGTQDKSDYSYLYP
jgi:hypothetical protein